MRRRRILWLLSVTVTILTMAAITGFSGQPAAESSAVSKGLTMRVLPLVQSVFPGVTLDGLHHFLRKLAHFTLFFILGCGLVGDFSIQCRISPFFCAVAAGALFAALDELHQRFSEGRAGTVQDVLLDTCGVVAGSAVLFGLTKLVLKRKETR